jgi:hypothetical protein
MSANGSGLTLDTELIILRQIYAYNPTTNTPISSNYVLSADGQGGTAWQDIFSNIATVSPVVGNLPSTISSLYSIDAGFSNVIEQNYISLSNAIAAGVTPGGATSNELLSTSAAIFDPAVYISSGNLISTQNYILSRSNDYANQITSTVTGLGRVGYVSTATLTSSLNGTVAALGTAGYVSTATLASTVAALGTAGYVSTATLTGTLNQLLYTSNTTSYGVVTTQGTDPNRVDYFAITSAYLSTNQYLTSNQLTTAGFTNGTQLSNAFTSTVAGLGTAGYVSTATLMSSINYLLRPITVNQLNNAYITNSVVTISSITDGLRTSNMPYVGTTGSVTGTGYGEPNSFQFSTLNLQLDKFSSIVSQTSQILVNYQPNWLFSPAVFPLGPTTVVQPIKTYVRTGSTSVAQYDTVLYETNSNTNQSNTFQQSIQFVIPGSVILSNSFSNPYILVHQLPSSISVGLTPGLLNSNVIVTPPTNPYILTIQNIAI